MGNIDYSKMRACVRQAFLHGIEGNMKDEHWQKMRHAIIFELNRLGVDRCDIKRQLMEWNERNLETLPYAKAKRVLAGYVDWFFTKKAFLSCKALRDYCIAEDAGCVFQKPQFIDKLPYRLHEAERHLETINRKHAHVMALILGVLADVRTEKRLPTVFIDTRTIADRLFDQWGTRLDPKDILRHVRRLEQAGFLRIRSGQAGDLGVRKANEYTLLPWAPPAVVSPAPLQYSICVANAEQLLCGNR